MNKRLEKYLDTRPATLNKGEITKRFNLSSGAFLWFAGRVYGYVEVDPVAGVWALSSG